MDDVDRRKLFLIGAAGTGMGGAALPARAAVRVAQPRGEAWAGADDLDGNVRRK